MKFPCINWYLLGTAVGSFWGVFAAFFYAPHPLPWRGFWNVVRSVLVLLFQFFFQFIGGFAGCIGLGIFIDRYKQGHFGWIELVLVCISLVAVSGKLSDIIYRLPGLAESRVDDFKKIIGKWLPSLLGGLKP
jgi:ABC-type Fe3+-siderophore transport system permease subunit